MHGFFDGRLGRERRQSGRFEPTKAPLLFASGALVRQFEVAHRHPAGRRRSPVSGLRLLRSGQNMALASGLALMPLMVMAGTLAEWLH
ncbi:MAG: hypothetical protein JOZ40_18610 [Methylobacteriaceae bacterium]|nr:hypothetical protein [Methylobacteriaceae bacterium]